MLNIHEMGHNSINPVAYFNLSESLQCMYIRAYLTNAVSWFLCPAILLGFLMILFRRPSAELLLKRTNLRRFIKPKVWFGVYKIYSVPFRLMGSVVHHSFVHPFFSAIYYLSTYFTFVLLVIII